MTLEDLAYLGLALYNIAFTFHLAADIVTDVTVSGTPLRVAAQLAASLSLPFVWPAFVLLCVTVLLDDTKTPVIRGIYVICAVLGGWYNWRHRKVCDNKDHWRGPWSRIRSRLTLRRRSAAAAPA